MVGKLEFKGEILYRRQGNKTMGDEYSWEFIIPEILKKKYEFLRFCYDVKTIGHLEVAFFLSQGKRELVLRKMQTEGGKLLQEM